MGCCGSVENKQLEEHRRLLESTSKSIQSDLSQAHAEQAALVQDNPHTNKQASTTAPTAYQRTYQQQQRQQQEQSLPGKKGLDENVEVDRRHLQVELLRKELSYLRKELEASQSAAQEAQKKLQAIQNERDELVQVIQQLRTEKESWSRTQNELNTELTALREKTHSSVDRRRYEEAQQQIVTLSAQLKAAEELIFRLQNENRQLRTSQFPPQKNVNSLIESQDISTVPSTSSSKNDSDRNIPTTLPSTTQSESVSTSKHMVTTPVTTPNATNITPVTTSNDTITTPVTTPNATNITPVTTSKDTITTSVTTPNATNITPVTTSNDTITTPVTTSNATNITPVTTSKDTITTSVTTSKDTITTSVTTGNTILENEVSKPKGRRRKDMFKVKAEVLYEFTAQNERQLSIKPGDIITVEERGQPGEWWLGELNGKIGLFPENYCRLILPKRVLSLSSQVKPKIRALQRDCGLLKHELSSSQTPLPPLPTSPSRLSDILSCPNNTPISPVSENNTPLSSNVTTEMTTTSSASPSWAPSSLTPRLMHATQSRVKGDPHRRPPYRILKHSINQTPPSESEVTSPSSPTNTMQMDRAGHVETENSSTENTYDKAGGAHERIESGEHEGPMMQQSETVSPAKQLHQISPIESTNNNAANSPSILQPLGRPGIELYKLQNFRHLAAEAVQKRKQQQQQQQQQQPTK
jgi:hypothetical protein